MGTDKRYQGYQPFDYLDASEDYVEFDLAEMHSGFPPHRIPLTDEQESRVAEIERESTIVSFHEHPSVFPADMPGELREYIEQGRLFTPYEYLAESNLDGLFDMHLAGISNIYSQEGWKWDEIVHAVAMRAADVAHQEFVFRAENTADIRRAREEGKLAFVPALESSAMIENELDRIELLYGLGIRCLGITYNTSNALGTGGGDVYERDGGLTGFGRDAVDRMNRVGMAISVSHASPQTALDVCETSDAPVLDTHSLAAGVSRGASDEELQAVADTGGVIGVVSSAMIPDVHHFMDHFEYMVDLVGINHVAFGPDLLYGDHRGLLETMARQYDLSLPENIRDRRHVDGLENTTEAWDNIVRWLVKEGYSREDIEKVLGENILRVLDEIW
jgi:membrane dipeptidase